jgi:hypothetical protein
MVAVRLAGFQAGRTAIGADDVASPDGRLESPFDRHSLRIVGLPAVLSLGVALVVPLGIRSAPPAGPFSFDFGVGGAPLPFRLALRVPMRTIPTALPLASLCAAAFSGA